MNYAVVFCAMGSLIAINMGAHGATLVQWGQGTDIVGGTRISTTVGTGNILTYTTPANPAIQSTSPDYYGTNAGRSPLFYSVTNNNINTTTSQLQIVNDFDPDAAGSADSRDVFRFNFDAGSAVANNSYGLALWTRYGSGAPGSPVFGFLNGGDNSANIVTLTSLSVTANSNSNATTVQNRFVIQLGASYFISSDIGDFPAGAGGWGTLAIADVTTANWFEYNPTTDFRTVGNSASISDFSNLNAVGIYYSRSTDLRFSNTSYSNFVATGTAIPEPSTWILLSGSLVALMALRRMSRK